MCIIIAKPKGVQISEDVLAECFRCNSHGGGIAYSEGGELVVRKGFFRFKPFLRLILDKMDKELVIHFRVQSRGQISMANCHPFKFKSEQFPQYSFALAHNGTLEWRSDADHSDTSCFVHDLLAPHFDRDPFFLDTPTGMMLLMKAIGPRNKFAIMRYDSNTDEVKTYIVNRTAGVEDLGCWFSNHSYFKYVPPVVNFPNGTSSLNLTWSEDNTVSGWRLADNGLWVGPSYCGIGAQTAMDRIMAGKPGRQVKRYIPEPPANNATIVLGGGGLGGGAMTTSDYDEEIEFRTWLRERGELPPEEDTVPQENILDDFPKEASLSSKELTHLGTQEKRMLRRLAWDFVKQIKRPMKGMTAGMAVTILRYYARMMVREEVVSLTNGQLDEWLLTQDDYYILGPNAWKTKTESDKLAEAGTN